MSDFKRLESMIQALAEQTERRHDEQVELSERRHMEQMKEIAHAKQNLHNVSLAVIGNEELGVRGMVKRVHDLEIQQAEVNSLPPRVLSLEQADKTRQKRHLMMVGFASAGSLIGGFSFSKLGQALIDLFTKHH